MIYLKNLTLEKIVETLDIIYHVSNAQFRSEPEKGDDI